MKVEKTNLLQSSSSVILKFNLLYETLKQLFKKNTTSFIFFKIFLIVFLLFIITIIVDKYTSFIDLSTDEKMQKLKEDRVKHFIDSYINTEGFNSGKKKTEEPPETLWETDTTPFSFNNVSVFQKRYGFLDETNDDISNYQEGFQEGFNIGREISRAFEGALDPIIGPIMFVVDKVKEGFEWLGKIDEWVDTTIIKPTRSFFQNVFDELRNLKERFTRLGWGLSDLFTAIGNTFVTLWNTTVTEFKDVGNLIVGGGKCSVHFVNNFRSCLIYYLFDVLASLIYHLFMLIPWMIDSIGNTNVVSQIKKVYTYIEKVDKIVKGIIGVSFLHYSQGVINTCYKCKDVDFTKLVKQLYDDNADIKTSFIDLGKQYDHAGKTLGSVFGNL